MQSEFYNLRGKFYGNLASDAQFIIHTNDLSASTAILKGYITLGMPQSLEGDDLLRSLVFGKQKIIDDWLDKFQKLAQYTYKPSLDSPVTIDDTYITTDDGEQLSYMSYMSYKDVANKRLNALHGELNAILNKINDGTFIEGNLVIEALLARLDLYKTWYMAILNNQGTTVVTPPTTFYP